MKLKIATTLTPIAFLAACSSPEAQWTVADDVAQATVTGTITATMDAGGIAKRELPAAPSASQVRLTYIANGNDRLGHPEATRLYTLTFDGGDVATANFNALDSWESFNLATTIEAHSAKGVGQVQRNCGLHARLCAMLPN